jgi:hypothetical protein
MLAFAMSDLEHVLRNRTTTSQPTQAMKHRPGRSPASHVVPVSQTDDEPIAESSRGPARRAATAGDPEVYLTKEAPSRAADHSAGPPVTQCSATLGHPTPEEGEAPLFENSDDELEYLRRKDARLEKQCEIERLRTRVLGKNTHQRGELLDALAEPPTPKRPTPVKLPTQRATVMPSDYGGHKQKDIVIFIRMV